ncbi:MAG: hypothetical protein J5814_06175 [Bacteroidaceae bacterium]|nr:hypothetical protein [Bacteroidaceae bacterium]
MKKEKKFFPSRKNFLEKGKCAGAAKRERQAWEKPQKGTCLRQPQHSVIYLKGENLHFFRVL